MLLHFKLSLVGGKQVLIKAVCASRIKIDVEEATDSTTPICEGRLRTNFRVFVVLMVGTALCFAAYALMNGESARANSERGVAETPRRTLTQLIPEQIEDTPDSRAKYPFLVSIFDQLRDDKQGLPDTAPGHVDVTIVTRAEANTDDDLAFTMTSGPLYCGTAGCPLKVFSLKPDAADTEILNAHAHIPESFFLSVCPNYTSVFFRAGHGTSIEWSEWRYSGESFENIGTFKELSHLTPCDKSSNK